MQIWLLPCALLISAVLIAIPLSKYLAWILDGKYKPLRIFAGIEQNFSSDGQEWQQYARSLIMFSCIVFVVSCIILATQQWMPLNPDGKGMLAPVTILNAVASFITNTDIQLYSGEQNLSNFSQIFFGLINMFVSAAIGLSALCAVIRGLRGDRHVGNFYLDIWRVIIYILIPIAFVFAIIFMQQGSPMTYQSSVQAITLEQSAHKQNIVVGPVAALESIKMLGTNGGGFYSMNAAHPFENPTAVSNFFINLEMMILPFAIVLMFGIMLNQKRHSHIIFYVMFMFMTAIIIWTVYFDTMQPNPAMVSHPPMSYAVSTRIEHNELTVNIPRVASLPVDQHQGNLEGKELRFGTSAGTVFSAISNTTNCGAINAEPDSFNPLAALAPLLGMWLYCIFGGTGVGMINILMYIIMSIFLSGMMVGRTPEYLGKKIGANEVKLTIAAMLIPPMLILLSLGLFAATNWGIEAISNPGAHGLTQMLYQLSSAASNNGSAFGGLNIDYGFLNNPNPPPSAIAWNIVTGLIMILSRFLPIIPPIAMAVSLGAKKARPFGMGTLRVDTFTFGMLLTVNLIIIGALMYLPVATLGPVAEQLGPIPFK